MARYLEVWQPTTANFISCSEESTLEDFVGCIKGHMPGNGYFDSNPYYSEAPKPTPTEIKDWRSVVAQMLDSSCTAIDLKSLTGFYSILEFTDSVTGKTYCVAMEVADVISDDNIVDKGFGAIIVDPSPKRELIIQIPHPLNDINTPEQGAHAFKETGAGVFLMAGAHRYASSQQSSCQSNNKELDVAHNKDNFFHAATIEIDSFYSGIAEEFNTIQFHGMGQSQCIGIDVFITFGTKSSIPVGSDEIIHDLRDNLRYQVYFNHGEEWSIEVAGDPDPVCNLRGSTNVQGRFLNGVPEADVCGTYANGYTTKFIHIEQKYDMRKSDYFDDWAKAFANTFTPALTITLYQSESGTNPTYNAGDLLGIWYCIDIPIQQEMVLFELEINAPWGNNLDSEPMILDDTGTICKEMFEEIVGADEINGQYTETVRLKDQGSGEVLTEDSISYIISTQ